MTPAQSHIATHIMNCIPDLSTLTVSNDTEAVWLIWKDDGVNMLGMISDKAKTGWISVPNPGRRAVLEKYCNAIQSITSLSIQFKRPDAEPLLDGDITMVWTIKETP
jgi:hypothetical protein